MNTATYVYRINGPTNDLEAKSTKARSDFENQYGNIVKIVGFGLDFFAVEVGPANAEQLPVEFEGFTKHSV